MNIINVNEVSNLKSPGTNTLIDASINLDELRSTDDLESHQFNQFDQPLPATLEKMRSKAVSGAGHFPKVEYKKKAIKHPPAHGVNRLEILHNPSVSSYLMHNSPQIKG